MYLLGIDIGSSSIKVSLVNATTRDCIVTVHNPQSELKINAIQIGWAEQAPEEWWLYVKKGIGQILSSTSVEPQEIKSIGISYQMHGLVMLDKDFEIIRPAIIWCDSRAVTIGNNAFEELGPSKCLNAQLNSPANFTASKLNWVKENEPDNYSRIYKIMLPGDFIAFKLSGKITTTVSGLSEGVLWDFQQHTVSEMVTRHYQIAPDLIPDLVDTFGIQCRISEGASNETGLMTSTPVGYRAGDQPNNALSLGVIQPGEVAATGGTSGVVYGVVDELTFDPKGRINAFAHVNHVKEDPRIGLLLCINGAGILYAWLRKQIATEGMTYTEMEHQISSIAIGSDGLRIIPFGNGAERMLNNIETGAQINNLQFNIHTKAHLYRAALEGIAFSFVYGVEVLNELGLNPQTIKAGNDNLFQSEVFSSTISNLIGCNIEILDTTGATGAAIASGVAVGIYPSIESAFNKLKVVKTYENEMDVKEYRAAYKLWLSDLKKLITDI